MRRRQNEEALLESERGFRLLVQGVTDYAIYMLDPTGHVANWNIGAQRIKGYSADEIVGHHFSKFYTPEDIAAGLPEKGLTTAAREGRYESEGWRLRKDGSKFWAIVVIDAIKDDNGKLIGFAKIARDITERRQSEEMLRRSQATYLAEAQRLSHTGSIGLNMDTGEVFWSEETYRIYGYDPVIKPSIDLAMERVHPDDLPRVRQMVQQAEQNRQGLDYEHRLLMPDGTVKTVHVRARELSDKIAVQPDTPVQRQVVVSVMDVTARAEAYAALQRSEQRYRELFDHVPVALLQLRTHGRVRRGQIIERLRSDGVTDFLAYLDQHPQYVRDALGGLRIEAVNEQAVRMFGARDAGELIAMTNERIWRDRPDTFRRILESRYHGKWTYQEETRITALDGRPIDVFFTIARPQRYDSDSGYILYGFIDITETVQTRGKLQNVEAEFAHAARLSVLGQLTASIAHEMNHPLAAVVVNGKAGLRWLNRDKPDIAEASEAMQAMIADAHRAREIITRMRGMASKRPRQQVSLMLGEVVEEALLFLRHELHSKQIAVSLNLAPTLPPVLADRIQLQQVIVNLAINAMHAMEQSNTSQRILAVGTARLGADALICTLEDSGPGIAQENLDRLFESFFTTKESGLGLGLAISRSIIEEHGGSLRVDNGSAYGGARFSFTLRTSPGL